MIFITIVFPDLEQLTNYTLPKIFPMINLVPFLKLIMKGTVYNDPVSLTHSTEVFYYHDFQGLFINLTNQFIFYIFLLCFFVNVAPRNFGKPKIGFRNIFKLSLWINLIKPMRKKKYYYSLPFINVNNLTKTFTNRTKTIHALKDLNFTIERGDVVMIIGPNGSGKSTLLNTLTGSLIADKGDLKIYGETADFQDLMTSIGFCCQENIFFPALSVQDHLEFFGKMHGIKKPLLENQIYILSDILGFRDQLDQRADKLNGGTARLVSTAMAYIGNPSLVILDEPTSGVDVRNRQLIWNCASYYTNITTIISSHSLEEGENIASKIFVLNGGDLIFKGTPQELRIKYSTGYKIMPIINGNFKEESEKITNDVLQLSTKIIPEAKLDLERSDCILIPVCDKVPQLLEILDENKENLLCDGFTITVEALEDSLLRLIIDYDEL